MDNNNILICGSSSFAARGLEALFLSNNFNVHTFNRGKEDCCQNSVTGKVSEIHNNKFLTGSFDTVINFLLLKGESIESNIFYIKSLLEFCRQKQVKHLIHISSVSVYKSSCRLINENAEVEVVPSQKGDYGARKVAIDNYLLNNPIENLTVSFIRPGFVLGKGLLNPIVGNAFRTPWNKLLLYGTKNSIMPLTTHKLLHQSILKLAQYIPQERLNTYIIVDNNSPSKVDYIETCSQLFGISESVMSFPTLLWLTAGFLGDIATKILLRKKMELYQKFYNATRETFYDSSHTEKVLGLHFSIDWKKELLNSLDKQDINYTIPNTNSADQFNIPDSINIIGFGRIIKLGAFTG